MSPRLNDNSLQVLYDLLYYPLYLSYRYPNRQAMFAAQCARSEELLGLIGPLLAEPPARVLDLGAGLGGWLSTVRQRYPNSQCLGIERSRSCIAFARRLGLPIEGSQESWASRDQTWDLISLQHVLEHLPCPEIILNRVSASLSPDGRVYIEVPNLLSEAWRTPLFFHVAHLHYFHRAGLEHLLRRCGLEPAEVFEPPLAQWPWALGILARRAGSRQHAAMDRIWTSRVRRALDAKLRGVPGWTPGDKWAAEPRAGM